MQSPRLLKSTSEVPPNKIEYADEEEYDDEDKYDDEDEEEYDDDEDEEEQNAASLAHHPLQTASNAVPSGHS